MLTHRIPWVIRRYLLLGPLLFGLSACSAYLPYAGPRAATVNAVASNRQLAGIQLVNVDYAMARQIKDTLARPRLKWLRDFVNQDPQRYVIGLGDVLQVYIWEAPPAMLFAPILATSPTDSGSIMTTIPSQMVGADGDISVPFVGMIPCAGRTLTQIATEIRKRLLGVAHDPQVVVHLAQNHAQSISVVGNVKKSLQVPLIPGGVNILQAIAAAGGVDRPVSKVTIQVTHDGKVLQMPLPAIIRCPLYNLSLRAGDIVTALYRPLRVTVMGATMQSKELAFKASGTSLGEALARVGGLNGNEADARAVYVFRFERPSLLRHWPKPLRTQRDGRVPVVFRMDFSNPATLFAAQTFPIQNHDLIYVATAPVADLQKFLGLIVQIVYPIQGLTSAGFIK